MHQNRLPDDNTEKEMLAKACETQQNHVLKNEQAIEVNPDDYKPKKFNLNDSVKRLHKGLGAKKRGNHYDCVPNGVFVRENPFVRERLYAYTSEKGWPEKAKNLDVAVYRLHHGRKEADDELIIHDQPFKNYSREGRN